MNIKQKKNSYAKAEEGKERNCDKCGRPIIGEYDFIKTRRGTKMYFHKGMKCGGRKHSGTGKSKA